MKNNEVIGLRRLIKDIKSLFPDVKKIKNEKNMEVFKMKKNEQFGLKSLMEELFPNIIPSKHINDYLRDSGKEFHINSDYNVVDSKDFFEMCKNGYIVLFDENRGRKNNGEINISPTHVRAIKKDFNPKFKRIIILSYTEDGRRLLITDGNHYVIGSYGYFMENNSEDFTFRFNLVPNDQHMEHYKIANRAKSHTGLNNYNSPSYAIGAVINKIALRFNLKTSFSAQVANTLYAYGFFGEKFNYLKAFSLRTPIKKQLSDIIGSFNDGLNLLHLDNEKFIRFEEAVKYYVDYFNALMEIFDYVDDRKQIESGYVDLMNLPTFLGFVVTDYLTVKNFTHYEPLILATRTKGILSEVRDIAVALTHGGKKPMEDTHNMLIGIMTNTLKEKEAKLKKIRRLKKK